MCGCDLLHLAHTAINKFKHSKCIMLSHHVAFIFTKNNILCSSENRLFPKKKKIDDLTKINNFVLKANTKSENILMKKNTNETSKHAEMGVLEKFNESSQFKKNGKYNLMVINFSGNNELKNSRPCFLCSNAIYKSKKKIKKIYYSTNDGNIISESIYSLLNMENMHFSIGFVNKIQFILRKILGTNVEIQNINTKTCGLVIKKE